MLRDILTHDTAHSASCNTQLSPGPLPCDAYHHYYHYQSSAQYLWLAETLRALGRNDEARAAYDKAIFQDHGNQEAIERKTSLAAGVALPTYDKHPLRDAAFCASIGEEAREVTRLHDAALTLSEEVSALQEFTAAIANDPSHSNSYFARGRISFTRTQWNEALDDFTDAIRLSHAAHDAYHRRASAEHMTRGVRFQAAGEIDLAIADFSKALDLHRGNKDALLARAALYRQKGSITLALEDERKLR